MADVNHALIALGANLNFGGKPPETTLKDAVTALGVRGMGMLRGSPLYRTPCFPAGAGPDYVNAVAQMAVPAGMDAAGCLALLHEVEAGFGRERVGRWGMRTLDLDLLALGDAVLPDAATQERWRDLDPRAQATTAPGGLILPHPRLQDRAFVLVPLAAVAPGWVHPATGQGVAAMLAALRPADRDDVREIIGVSLGSGVVKPPHRG